MEVDPRIQERLADLARSSDEAAGPIDATEVQVRAQRAGEARAGIPRRRVALVVIAVFGLVTTAGWLVLNDEKPPGVVIANDSSNLGPGQCRALPTAPMTGRVSPSAIWTGTEMIIWGGEQLLTARKALGDGAAYNPRTHHWRRLPAAPIEPRWSHIAIWTGTEMIVWGGNDATHSLRDGAAYDPRTNVWRRVPGAPIDGTAIPAVVWTGHEMLVLGGLEVVGQGGTARHEGAAFNPQTNRWRLLARDPFQATGPFTEGVWTGQVAVFVANSEVGSTRVASYDPSDDRWEASDLTFDGNAIGVPIWDNDSVLVFVGDKATNFSVDPTDLSTSALSDRPSKSTSGFATSGSLTHPLWTGDRVLFWSSGAASAYAPGADRWESYGASSGPIEISGETAVWTGKLLLAWGGFVNGRFGDARPLSSGVAFRPPVASATASDVACLVRQDQADAATPPARTAPKPKDVRVLVVDGSGTESSGVEMANSLRAAGYILVKPPVHIVEVAVRSSGNRGTKCRPAAEEATFALSDVVRSALRRSGFSPLGYTIQPPGSFSMREAHTADCVVTLGVPCIPDSPETIDTACHSSG